jgi:acetyl esterase/lipase
MSSQKTNQGKKSISGLRGFWQRHVLFRWLIRIITGILLLVAAVLLWFRISPWPGAMVVRWEFVQNGVKTTDALKKHALATGIVTISNQQYRSDDKDALLDVYIPEMAVTDAKKLPVVIWTHGGAWLAGDKANAAPYYQLLANAGFIVVVPDYSLAPDYIYPRPIHQLNAAHQYVINNADRFHVDTGNIILAGDSAGSQLSSEIAALITNPQYAQEVGIDPALDPQQLKGIVLNCGIYKMEKLAHPGPDLSKVLLWGDDVTVWAYSGTNDFSSPIIRQMSPYYHVTKDFPATFITGGNGDPLTDVQSKPLAGELQALGVSVTRLFYDPNHSPSLPHEYQFNLDTADGQNALKQIIAFIQSRTQ